MTFPFLFASRFALESPFEGGLLGLDKISPMLACPRLAMLQCARSVLLNKIISNEKDLVGIVLFGTVRNLSFNTQTNRHTIYIHYFVIESLDWEV